MLLVAAAVGGVYLVTSSGSGSRSNCATTTPATAPKTIQIYIYDGASNPSNTPGYTPDSVVLVIGVNNTVTWTNNDSAAHTVTSSIAPLCGSFGSGNMNPGDTYTHTFIVAGSYEYYCAYHHWMMGTILVKS